VSDRARTVVFAGGGTGGHIYPALAIAERLPPDVGVLFLCSSREIDSQILRKHAVEFVALPALPPGKSPGKLLAFARSFVSSFLMTKEHIERRAKHADIAMVAMGGFVCPPAALAARKMRIPVTLVNLDAEPGKANKFVDRFAERVFTAASGRRVPKNWSLVGPILRAGILTKATRAQSRKALGLDPNLRTLFVSGGSQGAGTINDAMRAFVAKHAEFLHGWHVFHQAGPAKDGDDAHTLALRDAYANARVPATVVPFCDKMGDAWNAADLALCRAGAGTVAEVLGTSTPAIFMPYPYHKDDHQRKNAQHLASAGGAQILTDHVDEVKNVIALRETLGALLKDAKTRDAMRESLKRLAPNDGAATIAQNIAW
jgi:UDP-N-acetylglucosamine--N-acetylmuramyl-(pentapeptide) pyrophosphoryl-undecaprenol N-acetylglucosamine transferase